jgi:hypothetical protein
MSEFNPTQPALVHDELNDIIIEWKPEWAEHFREHAIMEASGKVGWDGLILDWWKPPLAIV